MAIKNVNQPATPKDVQTLSNTINFMDCLSQDGFSEISAIAKLALAQLENPDGYRHPEMIARALTAIWGKAEDIENCINVEAEQVGCNYVDVSQARRRAAQAEARANGVATT